MEKVSLKTGRLQKTYRNSVDYAEIKFLNKSRQEKLFDEYYDQPDNINLRLEIGFELLNLCEMEY